MVNSWLKNRSRKCAVWELFLYVALCKGIMLLCGAQGARRVGKVFFTR